PYPGACPCPGRCSRGSRPAGWFGANGFGPDSLWSDNGFRITRFDDANAADLINTANTT
ncbi:MAG: hypothetical protein RL483_1285, partial [Pseudomonadota bacterium]